MVHDSEKVGNQDWSKFTAPLETNASPWHLRPAMQQTGLQVVCEAGKHRHGQVAFVGADLMTWDTGRGGETGLQPWHMQFPSEHLDILKNKHQLL